MIFVYFVHSLKMLTESSAQSTLQSSGISLLFPTPYATSLNHGWFYFFKWNPYYCISLLTSILHVNLLSRPISSTLLLELSMEKQLRSPHIRVPHNHFTE